MRKDRSGWSLFLLLAQLFWGVAGGHAQNVPVPLVWDPSPDAATPGKISGYKLYFAPHNLTNVTPGVTVPGTVTVVNAGNQTALTVTNLIGGLTYFFAVTAVDSAGTESDFSNITNFDVPTGDTAPPPPPDEEPGPTTTGTGTTTTGTTTTGTTSTGTTTTGSTSTGPSSPGSSSDGTGTNAPTQANLVGLLPRLTASLNPTNKQMRFNLSGALGATFTIESTDALAGGAEPWVTVGSVKMSTLAEGFEPPTGGALMKAFQPSVQDWEDTNAVSGALRVYRIVMPFGYAVVAAEVLNTNSYHARTIAIRLADLDAQVVCYVTEEGAYLHYDDETFFVTMDNSGPTIREVADKFGSVIEQNWTSASEFSVVDGLKQILATVVKTDDPSSDPPLGSSGGANIAIDF